MAGSFKNPILPGRVSSGSQPWVRPTDWVAIPSVANEEKFVGAVAIWENGFNGTAILCEGNYTVDWGDGTITNYASGVTASYDWDYNTIPGVVNSLGYKTTLVTITPQNGSNITKLDLTQNNTTTSLGGLNHWLDVEFNFPNLVTLAFSGSGTGSVRMDNVERVFIHSIGSVANLSNMFNGCVSLQLINQFDTSGVTNMNGMFNTCASLKTIPLLDTSGVTDMTSTFSNCNSLKSLPTLDTSSVTIFSGTFGGCRSLQMLPELNVESATSFPSILSASSNKITYSDLYNCKYTIDYSSQNLSKSAIENIFNNLGTKAAGAQFIAISSNFGAPTPVSLSGTTVTGSTTISMASTTNVTAGMQVVGTGSPLTTAIAVTLTDAGDLVTLNSHGLENGDEVSFASIASTTGIVINTIYYVINKTANDFKISSTVGGSALTLTTDGSGTIRYRTEVVSVDPNVSVTVTRPMTSSATNTLAFRLLKTGTALLKGWTVTG